MPAKHVAVLQLEVFKKKVVEAAIEMKEDHGYCDEALEEFLGKIGLEDHMPKNTFTFILEFRVDVGANDGEINNVEQDIYRVVETALKTSSLGDDYEDGSLTITDWYQ